MTIRMNTNPNGPQYVPLPVSLGVVPKPCKWVRQSEIDQGTRSGTTSSEQARVRELERENRERKRANEILRKAAAFFAQAELDRRPK